MPHLSYVRLAVVLLSVCTQGGPIDVVLAASPSTAIRGAPLVEMLPGRTYAAGTRVHIPKGNMACIIPAGWQAQLPEGADAIIVTSESGAGFVMIFAILNLTESELVTLLAESQPITHDLVFEPTGPVVKKGDRLTASYRAGTLVGRALSVMGKASEGVLFFLGRPPTEASHPDQVLEHLADSAERIDAR